MRCAKVVALSWLAFAPLGLGAGVACAAEPPSHGGPDAGPFVRALWLVQRYGSAEAANPRNDNRTKAALAKALGKDGSLSAEGAKALMDPTALNKLAGADGKLDAQEIRSALDADLPSSRRLLLPRAAAHAELLTTSFDMIDEAHAAVGERLTEWIATHYQAGKPLPIVFVCTGNSRRSVLGSTMGNLAAAYYGLPDIRCYSGGTAPTACNARTVACLKRIGVEVENTGREAPRGEPATANPIFKIRWGQAGSSGDPTLETTEFSKVYSDQSNPQRGFAALMVCSEADAGCPVVKGAALRLSTPYLDPKIYDGGAFEAAKYDERRDDMGRLMLSVMAQVRHRLVAAGKLP